MKAMFKYYRPAILWALFILFMCSIKMGKIGDSPLFFPGFDKLVHCGFFFVLVVFYCNGLIRQPSSRKLSYKRVLIVTVIVILYGGLIELLQLFVFTWRTGEWNDLFADAVGASMGAFSILITVNAISDVKK
jgi:VanZ family protein